jgi:AcrR family transcriptional regulator
MIRWLIQDAAMSPYPAQVDRERILEKARHMLEADGYDALTLAKLGEALGVKAPSLYKHYASKADLMRAVIGVTIRGLVAAMQDTGAGHTEPTARVYAMMGAYRAFALQNPVCYGLAYARYLPGLQPDTAELEALALPLQAMMAEVSGPAHALAALRGAWALLHGYVTLELNDQFRRGGALDEVFTQVTRAYLSGWRSLALAEEAPAGRPAAHGRN